MTSTESLIADGNADEHPARPARFRHSRRKEQTWKTESLDYEPVQNTIFFDRIKKNRALQRTFCGFSAFTALKNAVAVMTGVLTGLTSIAITMAVSSMTSWRNTHMDALLGAGGTHHAIAMLLSVAYGAVLTAFAACMVSYVAPNAAGAGVTLVMSYLNGNDMPALLTVKTLAIKILGTACSVASGLAIGPEGPMVHIGAAWAHTLTTLQCCQLRWFRQVLPCLACGGSSAAAGITSSDAPLELQGRRTTGQLLREAWEDLTQDSTQRELISAGAAAGLSAAFGAPIGGVLFSMEEACSFWSRTVAWLSFLSAVLSAFTIRQLTADGDKGFIVFRNIESLANYQWMHQLPLMLLVAVIGGLLGALFNAARRFLWRFRAPRTARGSRICEAIAANTITVLVVFVAASTLGQCVERPSYWPEDFRAMQWSCEEGMHNDVASVFYGNTDDVLGRLFSVRGHDSLHTDSGFTVRGLLVFSLFYVVLMALGAGVCVPAGVFMPSTLLGASTGLAIGMLLQDVLPDDYLIHPGLYALVCATAVLAGVFRSAISLVVLVVEGTHGIDSLFGIILAVVTANLVAGLFEHEGVYESEIEHDHSLKFLSHSPPRGLALLTAQQVATAPVTTVPPMLHVNAALGLLRSVQHNGFPVVDTPGTATQQGRLLGFILRSQLLILLKHRVFTHADGELVNAQHSSPEFKEHIEREMRLFYKVHYKDHRAQHKPWERSVMLGTEEASEAGSQAISLTVPPSKPFSPAGVAASQVGGPSVGRCAGTSTGTLDPLMDARVPVGGRMTLYSELDALTEGASRVAAATKVITDTVLLNDILRTMERVGNLFFDLRPYMNAAPLTVRQEMYATRVHRTFVTLGLRHLCVVNASNQVTGIITRQDLDVAAHRTSQRQRA